METLVILDYSTAEVHFYNVDPNANIDEEYIHNLGFHTSNCSWMFGQQMQITCHNEVLK